MRQSELRQMRATVGRLQQHQDALVVWEEGSFECCWPLLGLQRMLLMVAVVFAWHRGFAVVFALIVVKMTVDVVIGGSVQKLRRLEHVRQGSHNEVLTSF